MRPPGRRVGTEAPASRTVRRAAPSSGTRCARPRRRAARARAARQLGDRAAAFRATMAVMAHERARASEAAEQQVGPDDGGDLEAVDRLLAETDLGWDVEAQVLTLKQAAASVPPERAAAGEPTTDTSARTLPIPTPFELGPVAVRDAAEALPTVKMTKPRRSSRAPAAGASEPAASRAEPARARRKVAASTPPPAARASEPPPSAADARDRGQAAASPHRLPADMSHPSALVDLLHARIATLERAEDRVGLARAHVELAIASEIIASDDARAIAHAEDALRVHPGLSSAHAMLRRKRHARSALPAMIDHLEHELEAAVSEPHRVELLAEKARLLWALGDRSAEVRATWEQAL